MRTLIPELEAQGIESTVACCDSSNFDLGSQSKALGFGTKGKAWSYSPELEKWLANNIQNYQAVVVHGLWQYPSFATVRQMRKIRRGNGECPKLFVMPHGMLDPWFQKAKSRQIKAWRNWFYWKLLERHAVNTADCLLFTAELEKELARQAFRPYHPKREAVVSLGVNAPLHCTTEMRNAFRETCPGVAGSPYLLFLGRIDAKKGIDLLIDAYSKIVADAQGKSREVPALVIAGPLNSDYAKLMQQKSEQAGLLRFNSDAPQNRPAIYFAGMLQGDAKWGAFYGCEAFVLPSHQENFGIAVVEAIACGKPVLISSQINISREIESDGAALVCKDVLEDVETMLTKWLEIRKQVAEQMSQSASACYSTRYVPAMAAKQFSNVISSFVQ